MDKIILRVELASEVGKSSRCTELSLPATDYEMLDTLEKLQVQDDKEIEIEVLEYNYFGCLSPFLSEASLFDLNLLTRQLSKLTDMETIAFEGLLRMETEKKEPFGLPKLIDLAYNAGRDVCDVYPGIRSDRELGQHLVDGDLVKDLEGLPDSIISKLDIAKIGQEWREAEGGVFVFESHFVPGSYVIQHTELEPFYDSLPHSPQKPDYAILLELQWRDKSTTFPLPAHDGKWAEAQEALGISDWRGVTIRCLDCCVPSLLNSFEPSDYIVYLEQFARLLDKMVPKELTKFKAVLDACQETDLTAAINIAEALEKYNFTPQFASPEDMGMDFLRSSMGESAAEKLRPFVNVYAYGQHLMEEQGCKLTDYGVISREDGQSLTPSPPAPTRGGITGQTM